MSAPRTKINSKQEGHSTPKLRKRVEHMTHPGSCCHHCVPLLQMHKFTNTTTYRIHTAFHTVNHDYVDDNFGPLWISSDWGFGLPPAFCNSTHTVAIGYTHFEISLWSSIRHDEPISHPAHPTSTSYDRLFKCQNQGKTNACINQQKIFKSHKGLYAVNSAMSCRIWAIQSWAFKVKNR